MISQVMDYLVLKQKNPSVIEKHQTDPFLCIHLYTPKGRIDLAF